MQALDRIDFSNNWLTLVFVFALMLLVVLKTINQQKLFGYYSAFFIKGFIAKKTEEKRITVANFQHCIALFFCNNLCGFSFRWL